MAVIKFQVAGTQDLLELVFDVNARLRDTVNTRMRVRVRQCIPVTLINEAAIRTFERVMCNDC